MPAEAIGRARMNSTRAGSFELERRPLSLPSNCLSREQPAVVVLHPRLRPGRIASRNALSRAARSGERRFSRRTQRKRQIHTQEMRPRFPPRPQRRRNQQRAEPGLPRRAAVLLSQASHRRAAARRGEFGLDPRGGAPPRLEPFVLLPIRIIDERIAEKLRPRRRRPRGSLCCGLTRGRSPRARRRAGRQSPGDPGASSSSRPSPSPARVVSAVSPSPRKAARPAGLRAQSGAASAMRRRARSTAWARVKAWVGAWISMRASCSTKSSRLTSSPASHRLAQASWKWVRLTNPSAIGLDLMRSSRRASASSAAASAPKAAPGTGQSEAAPRGLAGVTRAARRHRSRRLGRGPA